MRCGASSTGATSTPGTTGWAAASRAPGCGASRPAPSSTTSTAPSTTTTTSGTTTDADPHELDNLANDPARAEALRDQYERLLAYEQESFVTFPLIRSRPAPGSSQEVPGRVGARRWSSCAGRVRRPCRPARSRPAGTRSTDTMPAPTRAVALTGSMWWVARPIWVMTTSRGSAVDCRTPSATAGATQRRHVDEQGRQSPHHQEQAEEDRHPLERRDVVEQRAGMELHAAHHEEDRDQEAEPDRLEAGLHGLGLVPVEGDADDEAGGERAEQDLEAQRRGHAAPGR